MAGLKFDRGRAALVAGAVFCWALAPSLGARADIGNTYTNYLVGISGGEPSIGYDNIRNAAMYGSGTAVKRLTWNDATAPPTMNAPAGNKPQTAVATLDAITIVDPFTSRSFNSQLLGACSATSFSDDAGQTWTPSQGCGTNTFLDHQTLGAGPFHAPVPGPPAPAYPGVVYYCAQNSFNGNCAASYDGGVTFNAGVPAYNGPSNALSDPDNTIKAEGGACSALHGHLRVGPDGTAYLMNMGCGGHPTAQNLTNYEYYGGTPALSISTDNGLSWSVHRLPAVQVPDGLGGSNLLDSPDESDPNLGISKGGVLYYGWENGTNPNDFSNGDKTQAMVGVSHDHGLTWTNITDISTRYGINNIQFPEAIAGDDDRAAVAFLGTSTIGDDQTNNNFPTGCSAAGTCFNPPAQWYLYIATTYDGGQTWDTVNATPNDPVQHGCIDLQGTAVGTSRTDVCSRRNLLDFNDITIDPVGRHLVAYADGCTGACMTTTNSSAASGVDYVLRQSSGRFLYAASDPVVPEAPIALLLPLAGIAALLLNRRRMLRAAA